MNKEVKELLNKCDNCKLKECIGCEFTYVDIQKIKKYVGNIEILNETYQVINELSEREIKKLEQKESILDKVTDLIKNETINIGGFECIAVEDLQNIIEEKNN